MVSILLLAGGLGYIIFKRWVFAFKSNIRFGKRLYPVQPKIAVIVPHPAKGYQVPVAIQVKYAYRFNMPVGFGLV
jgi:hypothetical protein